MSASASALVRAEWNRRIGVEYQSAALTHHLTLWLIQAGVSPDLVRLGLRIVDDELVHAELAVAVANAAGGVAMPTLDRTTLTLVRDENEPLERSIARVCIANYCLAETAAVRIFRCLQKRCTIPSARTALNRVLRDEVRHRDFGWILFEWLLDQAYGEALRAEIAAILPSLLAEISASYLPTGAEQRHDWAKIGDDDRAWGLAPLAEYRDALSACFVRDVVPRFAALGIDARANSAGW